LGVVHLEPSDAASDGCLKPTNALDDDHVDDEDEDDDDDDDDDDACARRVITRQRDDPRV
jgi:hypothetical protein